MPDTRTPSRLNQGLRPKTAGSGPPARGRKAAAASTISGVVDGSMMVHCDVDGYISFHIAIGPADARAEECDHVEFVLNAERAEALSQVLSPRAAGGVRASNHDRPIPCAVGLRRAQSARL